jgi:hypothetical protein
MENLYQILGVLPTASAQEIKDAYVREREKSMQSGLAEEQAAPWLAELDKAFALLGDPGARAEYDRALTSLVKTETPTALTFVERPATILRPESSLPQVEQRCPYCSAVNPLQASVCGTCGRQISNPCPNCGQPVILITSVCPRCNTFIPEYKERRTVQAEVVEKKTWSERRESEASVYALEEGHRNRAAQGIVFWMVVILACCGLSAIPFVVFYLVMNRP